MEDRNLDSIPITWTPSRRSRALIPWGPGSDRPGARPRARALGRSWPGPSGLSSGGHRSRRRRRRRTRGRRSRQPHVEHEFWSRNFQSRPYYKSGRQYSEYEPAYRFGWESAGRAAYAGKKFDEVESELRRDWPAARSDRPVDRCAGCDPRRVVEGSRKLRTGERRSAGSPDSDDSRMPGVIPGGSFLDLGRSSDRRVVRRRRRVVARASAVVLFVEPLFAPSSRSFVAFFSTSRPTLSAPDSIRKAPSRSACAEGSVPARESCLPGRPGRGPGSARGPRRRSPSR